jgi:acetolactate synthase regulatory subunit
MQHTQAQEEEQYADGLGEYSSFYGGPSYNYLAPAKLASQTVHELPASLPAEADLGRQPRSSSLQHAISYDLATNHLESRRDAEGLQVAYQQPNHVLPVTHHAIGPGYTKAEGPELAYQALNPGYSAQQPLENMSHSRYRDAPLGYALPSAVPAPLHYGKKHGAEQYLHQFPQPPTSPTSPTSQQHLHPAFRRPVPQQESPMPQPLRFQRSDTLPPTPPQSMGARTDDDALRDQMQYLKMGDPSPLLGRYSAGLPRFPHGTLARMNTMSSMSSGQSSTTPGSPFEQHHRISVAQPNTSKQGVIEQGPPEISPAEAHAEVLRLLDKADETSSRKSGGAVKKGFSLRRSNTTKPANNASHSQEALTTVLEHVAEGGSLPMVKAVISLGADPSYRSAGKMKKVKHEALTKATAAGHARVVDYLLAKGATYGEVQKKSTYTPLDRALLAAAYKGHAELASVLISGHGANPMIEQWPREMEDAQQYWNEKQLRLSKTSVIDGISHWKSEEQGLGVLRVIMQSTKFDPAAPVSGVFDNKSELQSAEYGHRPWQTTYEYSALACFVRAGWADAVEGLLSMKGSPQSYEKEDEVLQYQDKVTRHISPVNALTKDTWEQRPEDALRILRLLIERGFDVSLVQRTANDLGQRTALGRALAANASQAVELIAQSRPELVKEVISFRRNKKETKAQPLATAITLEKLDTARVLLRAGAHPRDPAFDMNVLQFAAHQGGETGTAMLAEMLPLAPELTYAALDIAIRRINKDCVRVLLDSISSAASRNEIAALPAIWDMLLPLSEDAETRTKYLDLIDMVFAWDAGYALPRPQLPAILAAIKRDNYVGMERMLQLGVVDGKSLVLNCKAQPLGEQGLWTVLECAEGTDRSAEWLGLLRGWGAPLYT